MKSKSKLIALAMTAALMLPVFTACSSESSDDSSTTDDSYDESTSYEETSSSSGETSDVTDVIGEVTYKSSSCLVMSVYEAAGK